MNANRNKTQKRASSLTDLSGSAFAAHLHATTNTFMHFLNHDAGEAYKRPWHRLERGLRLNRINQFVIEEAERLHLSETEKQGLQQALMKAHEKKILNSKNAVVYEPEEQKIKEIKGLVMHRKADGQVLFQVLEKRNAVTFRKKTQVQAQQQQQNAEESS